MNRLNIAIAIFAAISFWLGFFFGARFACAVAIDQGAAYRDASGRFHWITELPNE